MAPNGAVLGVVAATAAGLVAGAVDGARAESPALSVALNPGARAVDRTGGNRRPCAGVGLSCGGDDATKDEADPRLVIFGALAIPLGIAFCPLAIRAVAAGGGAPPVARLALRRPRPVPGRAGAALAAISLGLGLRSPIVIAAAAAEYRPDEGNLSDRQLMLRIDQANEVGTPVSRSGAGGGRCGRADVGGRSDRHDAGRS